MSVSLRTMRHAHGVRIRRGNCARSRSSGRQTDRGLVLVHRIRRRERGQSLVLVALILSFLAIFLLTAVEVAARYTQRAEIEDALRQASRSAVQTFAYDKFAQDKVALKATYSCLGTITGLCSTNHVAQKATAMFIANLGSVDGLRNGETPTTIANRVIWNIGPTGATCQDRVFSDPVVCAHLNAPLRGLTGRYGSWTPQVRAAEKIDRFANP